MRDPDVTVWCDGSADHNGNAGWAAVYVGRNGKVREVFHWDADACPMTNQAAEICAAILALSYLTREGVKVRLITDSNYIVRCFNEGWLDKWRKKGWRHKGAERPNRALWETLESIVAIHKLEFVHVYGHTGVARNERCDMLANYARVKCERERMVKEHNRLARESAQGSRYLGHQRDDDKRPLSDDKRVVRKARRSARSR